MKNARKKLALLLAALLCLPSTLAAASTDTGKKYTLKTKGLTVLQGESDRRVAFDPAALADNPVIEGESPTTGLPVTAAEPYLPMLVQISNGDGTATNFSGKKVSAAGLGKRAPWGVQYADILYESVLWRDGQTRMTCLFNDSFAESLPVSVGPVRSGRISSLLLSREWGGGLICSGMAQYEKEFGASLSVSDRCYTFSLLLNRYHDVKNRVQGVKAPDNYNVNPYGFRELFPCESTPAPHPFLFADESPYGDGYAPATRVWLDWGDSKGWYLSSFVYDEATDAYARFCGAKAAPYLAYASAENRDAADMTQLSFRNVVIQRVAYTYPDDNKIMPVLEAIGTGNADIFIGGRYIPGYWVRESVDSPTVFFDDKGEELRLSRGKTYIAHLSPLRLLAYGE